MSEATIYYNWMLCLYLVIFKLVLYLNAILQSKLPSISTYLVVFDEFVGCSIKNIYLKNCTHLL